MAIKFQCSNPECGKRLKMPDISAGRKSKCPECGTANVVADVTPQPESESSVRARSTVAMTSHEPDDPEAIAALVDRMADRFERKWKRGKTPSIEEFLGELQGPARVALLHELIRIDLEYQWRTGDQRKVESYGREFPELYGADASFPQDLRMFGQKVAAKYAVEPGAEETAVAEATTSVRGSTTLRCPYCQGQVTVERGGDTEVTCPNCDSPFRWDPVTSGASAPVALPDAIGKFKVLELLGRGGFGIVYKAHDPELDRMVAVKVPRSSTFSSSEEERRFLREASSAAQLKHPGIVEVFHIAGEGGTPYIVSEYVEGLDLAQILSGRRMTFRRSAELLARVAEAVDYAHQHKVIHRDIKPSNILIDGEGRPHVTDFGLARREDEETTVTLEGQVLGTPAYMSPEQATGETDVMDSRTDIYSLGVMFYELLTGEVPFRGSKRMMIHQLLNDEPRSPSRLNERIPLDLETICLKAMSKSPNRRYPSAGEMAEDLQRFLRGEPINARPVGPSERFRRWCARNPLVAGLGAAVLLLMMAMTAGATIAALRIASERDAKEQAFLSREEAWRVQRQRALEASEAMAQESLLAAEAGRWEEAQTRARSAQRLAPDGPWGEYAFGMVAWKRTDFQTAEEHFRKAQEIDTGHEPSKAALLQVLDESDLTGDAAKLVAEDPEQQSWQALRSAAETLYGARRFREAESAYTRALKLLEHPKGVPDTDDWGKLLGAADRFLVSALFPEARAACERALQALDAKGAKSPSARSRAKQKLAEAERGLKEVWQELAEMRDEAAAWVECEGFYESICELPPDEQGRRVTAKLSRLHGAAFNVAWNVEDGALTELRFQSRKSSLRHLQPFRGLRLERLDVSITQVVELQPLQGMPLKELDCSRSRVRDLSPLRGMPLESLNCSGTEVADLGSLAGLKLAALDCSATKVTDLSPLKGMSLRSLNVSSTEVSDLAPLRGMALTSLGCNHTRVTDWTPLKGMPLQELDAAHMLGFTPSVIEGMPLRKLQVCGVSQKDLSIFAEMPLEMLSINKGSVTDLGPLKDLALRTFYVTGMPDLEDLSGLRGMPLEVLLITQTPVRDFGPLKGMKLRHLSCPQTGLSDLTPLEGMPLTCVSISGTRVSDLSPLAGMKLTTFNCSGTEVSDISVLRGMPLNHIDISGTRVSDLSPLSGMKPTSLKCSNTPVSDISALREMPLHHLHLDGTRVTDLTPLEENRRPFQTLSLPQRKQLTPASLELIVKWRKMGYRITCED